VGGQVQHGFSLRSGQAGRDGDEFASQGGTAGFGEVSAGQSAGGAQQVVGDRGAQHPSGVRAETPGRNVGQRPVDQVGEHGLDDRVTAVGDVGDRGRTYRLRPDDSPQYRGEPAVHLLQPGEAGFIETDHFGRRFGGSPALR
jgi:hypothetical protein